MSRLEELDGSRLQARDASHDVAGDMSPPAARDMSLEAAGDGSALCAWCRRPMPPGKRRDAKTCSQPCRQAAHRFRIRRSELEATDRVYRLAYADPPYPGLAHRYYASAEVDHAELLERLSAYDGWALSTSSVALAGVLRLCPVGVRVCAWVKTPRAGRGWEPLIVWGGRPRSVATDRREVCDVLRWGGRQHSHPGALVGMKPAAFCQWMFAHLGARRGDVLEDLYPGSGAIGRAWELYTSPAPTRDTSSPGNRDG